MSSRNMSHDIKSNLGFSPPEQMFQAHVYCCEGFVAAYVDRVQIRITWQKYAEWLR